MLLSSYNLFREVGARRWLGALYAIDREVGVW